MKGDLCRIVGCDGAEYNRAQALCEKHYSRFKRFRRRGPRSRPTDVAFLPLRGFIEARLLSTTELSRICGLPMAAITKVLSGNRDLTETELDRICQVLEVEPEDIASADDLRAIRTSNFTGRAAVPVEVRFWRKVKKVDSGCWEWQGFRFEYGHGAFRATGHSQYAHRTAYEMLVGPIPEGLVLDHLCRNPPCVNPAHLEPVTNEENTRRGHRARKLEAEARRGA